MKKNMRVLNIKDMVEITKHIINSGVQRALAFLGLGGIGKSESMATLAEELGIGYLDLRLLQYNLTDFKGIPFKSEIEGYTKFLISDLLPRKATVGEDSNNPRFQDRGILVLDEITSCTTSLRTLMYQLINERCLGEYKLPEGWIIVLLGNGINDGGDFNGIEGNLLNRCFVYRVETSVNSFKEYLTSKYSSLVAGLIGGYLDYKPQNLHTFDSDAVDEDDLVFASPRSWVSIAKLLDLDEELKATGKVSEINRLLIAGAIGDRVALDFYSYIELYSKLPKFSNILDGEYDLMGSNSKYAKEFKKNDDIKTRLEKLGNKKGTSQFITEIKTTQERALSSVMVTGLVDSLIEEYNKLSTDVIESLGVGELHKDLRNFVDKVINAINFAYDYLNGDIVRQFSTLLYSTNYVKNKAKDFDSSTWYTLTAFNEDISNTDICRGDLTKEVDTFKASDNNANIVIKDN